MYTVSGGYAKTPTLRRWCVLTNVYYHDKPLAGEALEVFLRESSDRRLAQFIEWGESNYFSSKCRRRRIAQIADAITDGWELLYRGDPDRVLTSIDEQGYVVFPDGARTWLDLDSINQFWSFLVVEQGQKHVGGNAVVSALQQYLCDHPGQSIPLQRNASTVEVVLIDDDALAITASSRPFRLSDEDLERMHAWIANNRHDLVDQGVWQVFLREAASRRKLHVTIEPSARFQ
ncbi:hypothetical protein KSD_00550 [Ktedonobacter sp. SOSP1-85]|nr:hypothetical protein KSD_00550 [Ktedonobacter sp. SOSP1-85]